MTGVWRAIDCGTNSIRLLVGEPPSGGPTVHDARAAACASPASARASTPPARSTPRRSTAPSTCCASTASVMDDARRAERRPHRRRPRRPATPPTATTSSAPAAEIVGVAARAARRATEEGRLSFLGATAELDPAARPVPRRRHRRRLHRVRRRHRRAEASISVDIGCVRLTEKYLQHDPPLPEELSTACSRRRRSTSTTSPASCPAPPRRARSSAWPARSPPSPPSSSGSPTTTATASTTSSHPGSGRGRVPHPRHRDVEPSASHNPGLEEARADVIVGGCCVLVAIFRHFGFDECLVSRGRHPRRPRAEPARPRSRRAADRAGVVTTTPRRTAELRRPPAAEHVRPRRAST